MRWAPEQAIIAYACSGSDKAGRLHRLAFGEHFANFQEKTRTQLS